MRNLPSFTMGLNRTGLIRGTTSTYTTTVASAGIINNRHVTSLGVQTNAATPTLDAVTGLAFPPLAANKATVLLLGQTAAGVIQMCQGSIVNTATGVTTTAGDFINAPQFPFQPDDFMVLGYLLVRTAPTAATFIAGTSSWTATGVTTTEFIQASGRPDRPVIA